MKKFLPVVLGLCAVACGAREATEAEIAEAKELVGTAVDSAERIRTAADLLGLLPEHDCGEARNTYVGRVVNGLRADLGCATVTSEAIDGNSDKVTVAFAAEGCAVHGHPLKGTVEFRFQEGTNRFEASCDLHGATVDGEALPVMGGYASCADDASVWAEADGNIPRHPGATGKLEVKFTNEAGLPVIGGTTIVTDGTGEVVKAEARHAVTMTKLAYELGTYLPKSGTIDIAAASGHHVTATFTNTLWRLGKVEVTVDDAAPVEVPIVR